MFTTWPVIIYFLSADHSCTNCRFLLYRCSSCSSSHHSLNVVESYWTALNRSTLVVHQISLWHFKCWPLFLPSLLFWCMRALFFSFYFTAAVYVELSQALVICESGMMFKCQRWWVTCLKTNPKKCTFNKMCDLLCHAFKMSILLDLLIFIQLI